MHNKLENIFVPLNSLYLDPNNPRFADISSDKVPVPEERVIEEGVQRKALDRISNDSFEVRPLMDSIKTIGFLPVDQLVVVELPTQGNYMVVEGNRRLSAMKRLAKEHEEGEETLSESILQSIQNIPVLVIRDNDPKEREHYARVLQGVRHVSSVKTWGPYQQAQIVATMLENGNTMTEVKETLGSTSNRVNSLRRSYYGLRQMQKDEEYGNQATARLFSHFEEAYKSPAFRKWADWDDEASKYKNDENRRMFYGWCVEYEEDGTKHPAKITDAKDLRKLGTLMDKEAVFHRFCNSPTLTLSDAATDSGIEEEGGVPVDWQSLLKGCVRTLDKIPATSLLDATEDAIKEITALKQKCEALLKMVHVNNENP